ncbi:MAG TPA: MOSC domain-containing protein [Actinomycetota bacterium]|nr:MOSC domain-containing protein [Actinomycetota bacterium]
MPTIERINVTPLKGTLVHHPERVVLTERGIAGDRLFYLVDEWGEIFSGSSFGPLVRLRASFDAAAERLTIAFPDGTEVTGPANALGDGQTTNFYGRPVPAHTVEGPFSEAVSAFCSRPLRLLRCDREGDGIDVDPVTLVSTASVRDLAERGKHDGELDARRFRMSFDLGGCEPYEEESWAGRAVRIGEAAVEVGGQVPRCVFTTKDPETGEKDWNTLTKIAAYRPRIAGDGGLPFGVYARVIRGATVGIGDTVGSLSDAPA